MAENGLLYGPNGYPLILDGSIDWATQGGGGRNVPSAPMGGVFNQLSGLGGPKDKGDKTFFQPTVIGDGSYLQTLYVESWAASNAIDIPVDDMFIRGREWMSDDENAVMTMEDAYREYDAEAKLANVLKLARLFGGAILVMVIDGQGDMREPLDVSKVSEGNLRNLLAFDRFDLRIEKKYKELMEPKFGMPEEYCVVPRSNYEEDSAKIFVHESRCLRFDGKRPLSTMGWYGGYDRDWGVSVLLQALLEIGHDAGLVGAIAHLAQESSIMLVKLQNFQDAISGNTQVGEPSLMEMATGLSMYKSVFNMLFMDTADDAHRLSVNMSGFGELLDRFAKRLAAIFGIPETRFLASSPVGFNSTGESDMRNYALHVAAMQQRMLTHPLLILDEVIARSAGLQEVPEYEWLSLMELTDMDKAAVSKAKADALRVPYDMMALTPNEARERLSGDWLFQQLDENPELPEYPPPELEEETVVVEE